MSEETIKCPNCGTENSTNDTFCKECGKKLDDSQSVSAQSFNIAQYGDLTLTKDYVKQYISFIGKQYSAHIFLKDVSCVEIGFKSKPWLLWLGILIMLAPKSWFMDIPLIFVWGAAFILIGLYFILRKHTLTITSNGGAKISQIVAMGSVENANQFVGSLVMAKKNVLDAQR